MLQLAALDAATAALRLGAETDVGACDDRRLRDDVEYDANRNTPLDANVCLDLRHHQFTVAAGARHRDRCTERDCIRYRALHTRQR